MSMGYSVTPEQRVRVRELAATGVPAWRIGQDVDLSTNKVRDICRDIESPIRNSSRHGHGERIPDIDIPPATILGQLETAVACWPDLITVGTDALDRAAFWLHKLTLSPEMPPPMARRLSVALRDFQNGELTATQLGWQLDVLADEARLVPQARRAS